MRYLDCHDTKKEEYLKITIIRNVMPCNLVDKYQYFGESYCIHLEGSCTLKMNAAESSETLVSTYQTTRFHIQEHCNRNIQCQENVRPQTVHIKGKEGTFQIECMGICCLLTLLMALTVGIASNIINASIYELTMTSLDLFI
jgi:hypothetical protein